MQSPDESEGKAAACDHTSLPPRNTHKRNVRTTPREKSINQRFQLTLYGKSSFDKFFSPIYFTTSDSDSEVPAFN